MPIVCMDWLFEGGGVVLKSFNMHKERTVQNMLATDCDGNNEPYSGA